MSSFYIQMAIHLDIYLCIICLFINVILAIFILFFKYLFIQLLTLLYSFTCRISAAPLNDLDLWRYTNVLVSLLLKPPRAKPPLASSVKSGVTAMTTNVKIVPVLSGNKHQGNRPTSGAVAPKSASGYVYLNLGQRIFVTILYWVNSTVMLHFTKK